MVIGKRKNGSQNIEQKTWKSFFWFVPNLITFSSIICGLWAMYAVFTGQSAIISCCLIVIACFLDAMDGRTARFLGVDGTFGIELDSLADFFTFGISTMFVFFSYLVSNYDIQNQYIIFGILMLFPICMASRLARFNVGALSNDEPKEIKDFKKKFFCGMPAPAGAIALLLPVVLDSLQEQQLFSCYCIPVAYALLISFLLISRFPMPSIKSMKFGFNNVKEILTTIFVLFLIVFFFMRPIHCIIAVSLMYIVNIPIAFVRYSVGMAKIKQKLGIK